MSPFTPRNFSQEFEARQSWFKDSLRQNMLDIWRKQLEEITNASDVKNQHHIPLLRIKKIMKADQSVKMISAESPVLFAKACEMFILELTLRAWLHTQENGRRTLRRGDILKAIGNEELFDFLTDVVPVGSHHQEDMIGHLEAIDHHHHHPAISMNFSNMNSAPVDDEPTDNTPNLPSISNTDEEVRVASYFPGFK